MDTIMREIRPEEHDLLQEFLYQAIYLPDGVEPPPWSVVDLPELQVYVTDFGTRPGDHCMVAEVEKKVVGAAWSRIMEDYGHIDNDTPSLAISLLPEYRGLGIGTRLLNALLLLLRENGYRQASLSVQKENPALRLYERAGFRILAEKGTEYLMLWDFTRAVQQENVDTRFHGLTPAALRKSGGAVRSFAPLRIKVTLEGGQNMDCKIMKKEAFTVLCRAKTFKYEDAAAQVPKFWAEHFGTGGGKVVCGMYGINLDESMGGNEFEYLIADNYDPAKEIPDGFTTRTVPAHTWAVFPCTGRMPQALQGLNQQIFSQWLPTNPDYKIAAGINVELYSDASKFESGAQDQNYYCEVWIPVEKK